MISIRYCTADFFISTVFVIEQQFLVAPVACSACFVEVSGPHPKNIIAK